MKYDFNAIEKKWQERWAKNQTFKVSTGDESRPKYYVLDMFPYPSGSGLHVGHPLGYIASDIYSRYKRNKGFNVLHPMGFDSFGLPAEQYAIQTGQHPEITTEENIKRYRKQLDKLGLSFDWTRCLKTSDKNYYKWTQWIFIQLYNSWYNKTLDKAEPIKKLVAIFENQGNENINAVCNKGVKIFSAVYWNNLSNEDKEQLLLEYRLTYLADLNVNWCPNLKTVLANDEIVNGVSERGGHPVVQKKMKQWVMRITAYSERLLDGLNKIDWPEPLKELQRNWIGKSVGASITFEVANSLKKINVFSTRPDTIFGATFVVLAPELTLVNTITTQENKIKVNKYIKITEKKSERNRLMEKSISGIFTGAYALHPITKKRLPIWVSDYVLANYGTGAVMAVPCGDQRDYDFAKFFKLPIINIFDNIDISKNAYNKKEVLIKNSKFISGLNVEEASEGVILYLEKNKKGKRFINYRLRDAVFSRQRYWGEPIPIYYKNNTPYVIEQLPLELPKVDKYLPTENGDPPFGNAEEWAWDSVNKKVVENIKIDHKAIFPIDLNTMPGWAGSSWYFNRYMDSKNKKEFTSKSAINYWQFVDLYIGGNEHATGHLLYSRFWQKCLFDLGYLTEDEYAAKLINQGMILGESAYIEARALPINKQIFESSNLLKEEDVKYKLHVDVSFVNSSNELNIDAFKRWRPEFKNAKFVKDKNNVFYVRRVAEKMSKSRYNVVNPDEICERYGADTLRLYEMFLGPIEQYKPWNTAGLSGVFSFLKKFWNLFYENDNWCVNDQTPSTESLKTLHKTIKKVSEDLEKFSFNTAVSSFMICVNELKSQKCKSRKILESLVVLLAPFTPHIAEELWEKLGNSKTISFQPYPVFKEKYLIENEKKYPISVNGKMKFILELPLDMSKEDIEKTVLENNKVKAILNGKMPKKVIVIPNKIVNIVC